LKLKKKKIEKEKLQKEEERKKNDEKNKSKFANQKSVDNSTRDNNSNRKSKHENDHPKDQKNKEKPAPKQQQQHQPPAPKQPQQKSPLSTKKNQTQTQTQTEETQGNKKPNFGVKSFDEIIAKKKKEVPTQVEEAKVTSQPKKRTQEQISPAISKKTKTAPEEEEIDDDIVELDENAEIDPDEDLNIED